jgi:hypothetical protein
MKCKNKKTFNVFYFLYLLDNVNVKTSLNSIFLSSFYFCFESNDRIKVKSYLNFITFFIY